MKLELSQNKVFFNNGVERKEIHPFWLRERVVGEKFLDKGTQQRLFDPTFLNNEISIDKAIINNNYLELDFNDGVSTKLDIKNLALEFFNDDKVIKSINKIKWNNSLTKLKDFKYHNSIFDSEEMYDLLISFYEYGFVIIKEVPNTEDFIIKFANSIGSVRRTNFGECFNVISKPNPNDLVYTSLVL